MNLCDILERNSNLCPLNVGESTRGRLHFVCMVKYFFVVSIINA